LLTDLNDKQKQAVTHTGGPLLISAGPGSGKTRVLIERILFLLSSGVKPGEILCLTYSQKAANELKQKIEENPEIKGIIDVSEMNVSTYHSFCRTVLRDNVLHTGLAMTGDVIDRSPFLIWGIKNIDTFGFDEHIEVKNNTSELITTLIEGISVFNAELITPEELENYVQSKIGQITLVGDVEFQEYLHLLGNLVKIYKAYNEYKKKVDVMDFDDLIVETNRLLTNPQKINVKTRLQNSFKHILVDEFQDNNFAQFSLLKNLIKDGNITVVGDDDQNIYRFQGAYTTIFDDFRKTFDPHTEILLPINYRNPPHLINFSGKLISQDIHRRPKNIIPEKQSGDKVNVIECSNDIAQAEFIKNTILSIKSQNPDYEFKDFAILTRKQKDGMMIAKLLISAGIPINYKGKSQIRSSKSARLIFSYLRIISDPMNSIISIVRILEEHGISPQNIARINQEAKKRSWGKINGDYAFEVLSDLNVQDLTQQTEIKDVYELLQSFIKLVQQHTVSQTVYMISRNRTPIYKKISNDDSIENFIERSIIDDIIESSHDFETVFPNGTMTEFLEYVDQLQAMDVETKTSQIDTNSVMVSTIHGSKGLEFRTVFVADVAARKIPLRYTENPFYVPNELAKGVIPPSDPRGEFLREERRVFYVAITRAIDNLFITFPTKYGSNIRSNKMSKFLEDLDPKNNPDVKYDTYVFSSTRTGTDSVDTLDILMEKTIDEVTDRLQSNQFPSAIQKIIDLAKIHDYKQFKNQSQFDIASLIPNSVSQEVLNQLGGQVEKLGFSGKHLSFTAFDTYRDCPKKFWYNYVLHALPKEQSTPSLYKGKVFHDIVKDSANRQMNGKVDDIDTLKSEINSKWSSTAYFQQSLFKESEDRGTLETALVSYQNWTSTNPNQIVGTEIDFTFEIGGIPVEGKIDRLEATPNGDLEIIDFKTGGKTRKIDMRTDGLQLLIYAMALPHIDKYKKLPSKVSYFFPEKNPGEQLHPLDIDQAKIDEAKQELEGYVTQIRNKEFDATPEYIKCKYCPFNDICDSVIKSNT